jgi:hexokinase
MRSSPQNVRAELTALINDTTGTLIASSYVNSATRIAVIFGTGCNAAYMERIGDIHKIKNLGIDDEAQMAINCEWVCKRFMGTLSFVDDPDYSLPFRARLILSNMNTFQGQSTIR